jgi:hypothetical protein
MFLKISLPAESETCIFLRVSLGEILGCGKGAEGREPKLALILLPN